MDIQVIPNILLLGALFGSSMIASRFCIGQFAPMNYVGLRLVLASLAHVMVYLLAIGGRKWPTDRQLWRRAAFLGIFDTAVPMTLIVTSLQYQSSGLTAILITVGPAFTALLAHFTLDDEPLTRRRLGGIGLALGGALLLGLLGETGLPDVRQTNSIGYLLVLIAMVSASAMSIYTRRFMGDYDSFQVTTVRMFTAAALVMPLSLLLFGLDLSQVTSQGVFALGYAAIIGTFFAFWIWIRNVQRFGATQSAMVTYVTPVVAAGLGALLLDESITMGMLGGMALIAAGLAIINRRSNPETHGIKALIFDWGDTLMRDLPQYSGPMVTWPRVVPVPGAQRALQALSGSYSCCVASNAGDSDADLMAQALDRVQLLPYLDQLWTSRELGASKPDPAFFHAILGKLSLAPEHCVMVGNDYAKDIAPAREAGMKTVWLAPRQVVEQSHPPAADAIIADLGDLSQALDQIGRSEDQVGR